MRFIAVQTDPKWMNVHENRLSIERQLQEAHPSPGDFVVLPEMCETGWTSDAASCRIAIGTQDVNSMAWLSGLARRQQCWIQAGCALEVNGSTFANAVVIMAPNGECKAIYRKNFLFPTERDQYIAGDQISLVDVDGVTVCPMICYDLRFPELWRLATRAGAEVFTVSSSWPEIRHEHWRALLVARAIENQAVVIASNRTGTDPSLRYAGGTVTIDQLGNRSSECDASPQSISMEFNRTDFDAWRDKFGALRDMRTSLLGAITVQYVDR